MTTQIFMQALYAQAAGRQFKKVGAAPADSKRGQILTRGSDEKLAGHESVTCGTIVGGSFDLPTLVADKSRTMN
jgi:hypothetical protein